MGKGKRNKRGRRTFDDGSGGFKKIMKKKLKDRDIRIKHRRRAKRNKRSAIKF